MLLPLLHAWLTLMPDSCNCYCTGAALKQIRPNSCTALIQGSGRPDALTPHILRIFCWMVKAAPDARTP